MAITKLQFSSLDEIFNYYNKVLFEKELPDCLVQFARSRSAHGYFAPDRWKGEEKEEGLIHEIALNPQSMYRPPIEWHATLVHEMVHHWQYKYDKPSRNGYHNKKWAAKMESVGLMPSNTGEEGGKKTGQSMTHYIIQGGKFSKAFEKISSNTNRIIALKYMPNVSPPGNPEDQEEGEEKKKKKSGVKIKYVCGCNLNVWGKSGMKLLCYHCKDEFREL